jgi:predicted GNAT family acetyltransferase
MNDVKLSLNDKQHGAFQVTDGNEILGEMVVSITGSNLTVYHTEVAAKAEGKGLAKKMLDTMVEYVKSNNLKVIPLCVYVQAQFKRHSNDYKDIWNTDHAV